MTPGLFAILSAVFVVLFAALAFFGWQSRSKRHPGLVEPSEPTADFVADFSVEALYVASTVHEQPYERITRYEFGFRAPCVIQVGNTGAVIELPKRNVFIARSAMLAAGPATWTIDRVVEPGGMVCLTWDLGETTLDTYVRVRSDQAHLISYLQSLTGESEATA
ncbi:hypothetical protein [Humidisolicoccus flavus]|uniref:PH-like domain-containing protein n=1 Tax=Humidisolicoccus flavus TaxID=3111414 RepID=UPI003245B5A7